MTAKWPLPFVLVLGVTATRAAGPAVTIDTASPSGKVSPLFYGLMTEEINHAYDGGLYAELVRNVPVTSTVTGVKSGFTYTVPKHGIVVLTMRTR